MELSPFTQIIWSDIFWARSSSCRDISTATFFSRTIFLRRYKSSSLCRISKNAVGSSNTMTCGSWQMALARRTLWRCPSLTASKSFSASSSPWTSSKDSLTICQSFFCQDPHFPCIRIPPHTYHFFTGHPLCFHSGRSSSQTYEGQSLFLHGPHRGFIQPHCPFYQFQLTDQAL